MCCCLAPDWLHIACHASLDLGDWCPRRRRRGVGGALEVAVAWTYGVGRDAMAAIIDQFPKVDAAEREAVLVPALWRRGRRR
jgi:hypothetical protein